MPRYLTFDGMFSLTTPLEIGVKLIKYIFNSTGHITLTIKQIKNKTKYQSYIYFFYRITQKVKYGEMEEYKFLHLLLNIVTSSNML